MKNLLLSFSLIPLLAGCVEVPKTTILVPTANGTVKIVAPKDSKILGLKANFEKGTVQLDSYEAKMNPDVIGASAAGQVELIKAYGDLANGMAQLGLRAFAASQGIPLGGGIAAPAPQQSTAISTEQLNALIQRRAQELAQQQQAAAAVAAQPATPPNTPATARSERIRARTNAPPSTVSTNAPVAPVP